MPQISPVSDVAGQISDPAIFREQCYVNGCWTGDAVTQVTNPHDGSVLGAIPNFGVDETAQAIEAASEAFRGWSARTAHERGRLITRWATLTMEHREDLARILTLEGGKPIQESRREIAYGASFLEWFAEEARRAYGDTIPADNPRHRIVTLRQPIGVTAAITPWNFPNAMITRKAGAALAAGCTMIVKPAPETPFSALALAVLAERAGIPPGVFNVITGDAAAIGRELTTSPAVRKLSFTGSTEVGRILLRQSAETIKKVTLELGGNAPFLVFNDADLDKAVAGAVASKFRNAGQTCVCANRILVEDGVYDAFATKLHAAVRTLKVGNGLDEDVKVGPLINREALAKVERHVSDAVRRGATLLCGGRPHPLGGLYYEPTILTNVQPGSALLGEETFGPVAPLVRFMSEAEALGMANDTESGLAAYFYTRDTARAWRVAEALEYGMVGINEGMISTAVAPFGGIKQSGLGREGSKYGIDEYLEMKYLCFNIS